MKTSIEWMKANWRYVVMAVTALGVITDLGTQYLAEDKTPTFAEFLPIVLTGIFAWLKKAPGDFTHDEAHELAQEHAKEAVRQVSMAPPPPEE